MCTVTDEECALDNLSPIQEELKKDNKLDYKQVKILTIDDLIRMVREKGLYTPLEVETENVASTHGSIAN